VAVNYDREPISSARGAYWLDSSVVIVRAYSYRAHTRGSVVSWGRLAGPTQTQISMHFLVVWYAARLGAWGFGPCLAIGLLNYAGHARPFKDALCDDCHSMRSSQTHAIGKLESTSKLGCDRNIYIYIS
jgi:hypothetical protein